MGKFSGIMIISDIDGTLVRRDQSIGERTIQAIEHFQPEGGRFTLATGRMPGSMARFLGQIRLNAPAICYNGAMIHNPATDTTLWQLILDERAVEVLEHVERQLPGSGIELYHDNRIFFCKITPLVAEHIAVERFTVREVDFHSIPQPWTKAIFIQDPAATVLVKQHLLASEFASRYQFVRSGDTFFELLPQGASKGRALVELARLCGQDLRRTIAVGDNENDVEMLRTAGLGVAVDNAADQVKEHADRITVHHEEDAIHQVIEDLDRGLIQL